MTAEVEGGIDNVVFKQRDKERKIELTSQLSSSVNSATKELFDAWERDDLPGMQLLIYEKVTEEDYCTSTTCHLNEKIFEEKGEEKQEDEEESSEPVKKEIKKGMKKVRKVFNEGRKVFNNVIEMRPEDEGRMSFIEVFFDLDQDIEEKLKSLKPLEYIREGKDPRKELKCFYRIFLTAAAREMRHDIVDKMLHVIRHDEMFQACKLIVGVPSVRILLCHNGNTLKPRFEAPL